MTNAEKVADFLDKARVFYCATNDDNGFPKVRPFSYWDYKADEDRIYFFTGAFKNVYK